MINENRIVPYKASALPVREGPWLVIAPHADDETFGMGGTIAKAVAAGIRVMPVIMTNGELGGSDENLVQVREQEACRAAKLLGMESPQFLGFDDRGLQLNGQTVSRLVSVIKKASPAAVFFPGVFELHPDHRTTAAITWRALREGGEGKVIPVSYEILVQSPVNCLVDITDEIESKRAAMALYQSQLAENRYTEITLALNTLRTLTLPSTTKFAEGFFLYSTKDVHMDLWEFISGEISRYF